MTRFQTDVGISRSIRSRKQVALLSQKGRAILRVCQSVSSKFVLFSYHLVLCFIILLSFFNPASDAAILNKPFNR